MPVIHPSLNKSSIEIGSSAKTEHLLLRLLRAKQPISRIALARLLQVNRSTVTDIVKPLIQKGLLCEESFRAPEKSNVLGRPPIGLSFMDDGNFFVGLNLGVRRSQVGITTLAGDILVEDEFETPAEPAEALSLASAMIKKLCRQIIGRSLTGIGVCVPGPTDAERRKLLYAPNLDWNNVAIAEALEKGLDNWLDVSAKKVPVVVENDATAAAIYEARMKIRHSATNLLSNFILVRSGTGIGVGIVLDGEVYRGMGQGKGLAGEFGHMTIMAGGKPCVCGNRGCWEKYASAGSASSLYMGDRQQLGADRAPRFVDIVERAEVGEIRAKRTLEKVGEYLGIGIANVIMGVGVPHVIVSGRLVYGWKFIKKPLHDAISKSIVGRLPGWSVEAGEPKGAAVGGASEVAVEEYLANGFN